MKYQSRLTEKRILITGGAGFIGCNLVEFVLQQNQVVCLDNLRARFYKNIEAVIEGDIRDLETCKSADTDCDYVFHVGKKIK